jgi:DNA-directed RNA polymerase specialized sigma24 family protein
VLVLTGYLGFSTEEAADALGISQATVRTTASHARASVREMQVPGDG